MKLAKKILNGDEWCWRSSFLVLQFVEMMMMMIKTVVNFAVYKWHGGENENRKICVACLSVKNEIWRDFYASFFSLNRIEIKIWQFWGYVFHVAY